MTQTSMSRAEVMDLIHQKAFEIGGTDDGGYILDGFELDDVVICAIDLLQQSAWVPEPRLMSALRRFNETTEDDASYDVDASVMRELAAWGVVRRRGTSTWYELTKVGIAALALPAPPKAQEKEAR